MIHLDTTFLVDAIRETRRQSAGPARQWLADNGGEELAISVFVRAELLVGAALHAEPERERLRVLQVCRDLPVVAPGPRLAETYASVAAGLQRQGTPIATMDLLIGCTALDANAALLTGNRKHFERIVGLRLLGY
ncbi:MAG: type II toxin-antitoxin system VapC family toxin [Dermatophilaceae bacterium]